MPVPPTHGSVSAFLGKCVDVVNRLVMIFWRGRRYTIYVLYRCGVSPLSCGRYRFNFLAEGSVKGDIEFSPCLLVGGLKFPLPDVVIEDCHMFQYGYPF